MTNMTNKKTKVNSKFQKGGFIVKGAVGNRIKELEGRTSNNFKPKSLANFGKVFNNRTSSQRKEDNNSRNEARFFRELGRPKTKYNTNNRQEWEKHYLERVDKYLDEKNHESGLSKYQLLKRGQRRMNNNLYKTRAVLEKTKGHGWNRNNRNDKFDRMFTMTKKQLHHIRNKPEEYLENPDDFMSEPDIENTPAIGRIN